MLADEGIVSRRSLILFRWGVFVLACVFLFVRFARADQALSVHALEQALRSLDTTALTGLVVLMLLNWGIESWKWRLLVHEVEPMGRWRAFVATLAGTSIGLITPNRVGEFLGRVLFLAPEHRIAGSFATAVGSISQFIVTLVLGLTGVVSIIGMGDWEGAPMLATAWAGSCALVACVALLVYYNPGLLRVLAGRLPFIRRWERHADVLDRFGARTLSRVLLMSAARYAVFAMQFAWLLNALAGIPWATALMSVPAAFLVGTLIPTVMLTEIGVRGSVAVALISPDDTHDQLIFLSSTLLWAINLALPAMLGACIVLTARIRTSRA